MKHNLLSATLLALMLSLPAIAQTSADAASGAASTKIGVIDIQAAILATNEGRREFETLQKKFEPRQNDLQKLNQDVEEMKKQLQNQGSKLNDDSRNTLVKGIETKQKSLQRQAEDAQSEFQQQRDEIAGRILQKLGPVLDKYAKAGNYAVILDASQPWPQGQVVWAAQPVDVTKDIVDAYNSQSGVAAAPAAPAAPSAAKPAPAAPAKAAPAAKPAAPAAKPAQ
ncbi:MAG TPA: OmpH family outer membrane protein [Terriglobales bacterium]|jgi:outer membrane protein|nr:OmpH family outer membrane protein [Terriglobales bacterium]